MGKLAKLVKEMHKKMRFFYEFFVVFFNFLLYITFLRILYLFFTQLIVIRC